jgi:ABC-type multidrug transport system ATPase subunit
MQNSGQKLDVIQAIGLSKRFDGRQVLRHVDLTIAAGESPAILGPIGAGKTTLLRCLAGITRPDAGELWCHGEQIKRNPSVNLGMVAHESQLYPNLTLHENLLFAARMYCVPQPQQQAGDWLERIGLSLYANCFPYQISHGMRRRVSVARGLIHQPCIVLLDEPFSGLDSEARTWLTGLLASLQKKRQSICFTTHDAEQAQLCADQVLCLKNGSLQNAFPAEHPTLKHSLSQRQAA